MTRYGRDPDGSKGRTVPVTGFLPGSVVGVAPRRQDETRRLFPVRVFPLSHQWRGSRFLFPYRAPVAETATTGEMRSDVCGVTNGTV